MSVEQHQIPETPPRPRWWLWGLVLLVILLSIGPVGKWWWRTTLSWHSEAHALADQGHYDDAISLLDRAMLLSPDPGVRHGSYAVRANFHARMGNLNQAIFDMDRAVAWGEEQGDRFLVRDVVTRGVYKLRADRIDDAVSDFDLALELVAREDEIWRERFSHFAAMAHYYRGVAHQQSGHDADADEDLRAAEELDPEWVATLSGEPE